MQYAAMATSMSAAEADVNSLWVRTYARCCLPSTVLVSSHCGSSLGCIYSRMFAPKGQLDVAFLSIPTAGTSAMETKSDMCYLLASFVAQPSRTSLGPCYEVAADSVKAAISRLECCQL